MFNYKEMDITKVIFHKVAPIGDLPKGERLFVEIDGTPIVILNLEGQIAAIGDLCTHDNGPLGDGEIDEHEIICPRHGARFDILTGKALGLPAVTDIPVFPVRVTDGMIEVGIPI
jgi:3-phenylpropionate/trans-cinnamate dioxygenase ferredoxin component